MEFKHILKIGLFILFYSNSALAALQLNATRYIVNEGDKSIEIKIENIADKTYAAQIWIENEDEKDKKVNFIPMPNFFKFNKGETQIVRILNTQKSPSIKNESLYWLNLQEIPPVDKSKKSRITLALKTRVKLIYRPKTLLDKRANAEKLLTIFKSNESIKITNPTPFYLAVVSVKLNGKEVKLNNDMKQQLGVFPPKSSVFIKNNDVTSISKFEFDAINDYGTVSHFQGKLGY
ncbi:chaperone protein FanE precursor [Photobacterium sp. SKA34]|uniref:fimbria/pilus periplasmic chaperone n=1 Tax=Photobacterium sp. SKA34 TaxID=121723 RepID=UPI00006B694D|nr:fimbria/pilus periplasmic chaperone [Photobacterium sp. SKA34]EAR54642.1 chaperone protein FanE precursor [Photobacterium sp. SKA34]